MEEPNRLVSALLDRVRDAKEASRSAVDGYEHDGLTFPSKRLGLLEKTFGFQVQIRSLAPGSQLEHLTEQDEGNNDRGRLEIEGECSGVRITKRRREEPGLKRWRRGLPGIRSEIISARIGMVKTTEIQNLRLMSLSSGFSSSVTTLRGSRAIPQIGQLPGSERTISGCIGQVHSTRVAGAATVSGSRAIPHLGQAPGSS